MPWFPSDGNLYRSNGGIVGAINVVGPSFRINRPAQLKIARAATAAATSWELAIQAR